MISYLQGTLLDCGPDGCTLLTPGGVGYELKVPATCLDRLPETGEEVGLYVRTLVREDAIELYGFSDKQEQQTFALLLSVSKLGPKTALAILSTFDPANLSQIVCREDCQALTRVPGIGQKSARRLIWELKDKFAGWNPQFSTPQAREIGARRTVFSDALAGLTNLGYSDGEVRFLLTRVIDEEPELLVGEAIRAVLKQLKKDAPSR
ncbi:MAG: Holliday junction branch migration protein RuvA [Thermodesulfobacteriota bacterium]